MATTGILVVNLGTPRSFKRKDVAIYLREFLTDGRVIDIPAWKRWLLVNLIIAPFRAPKVAKEYAKLWTTEGSPLLVYGRELVRKLAHYFHDDVTIELAMRYQEPSIKQGLEKLRQKKPDQLIIFPLFPQYASATIGSVVQKVMNIVRKWNITPTITFINSYHDNEAYINAFVSNIRKDMEQYRPDHILFSYHGIPERHLVKSNEDNIEHCRHTNGHTGVCQAQSRYCYRSACYHTTLLIADRLGLTPDRYTTSFQSRLGKSPWIKPYTDETVEVLAQKGTRNLLVVSPSFVADCLETTLEIGDQYRDLFLENGGETFHFTESLNASDKWVEAVYTIIAGEMAATDADQNNFAKPVGTTVS